MSILNPKSFRLIPNLLVAGQPNHITPHNFHMLFHAMNLQTNVGNGMWRTIRPRYRRGGVDVERQANTIPFMYGANGYGAVMPDDWIDEPVIIEIAEAKGSRAKRTTFDL